MSDLIHRITSDLQQKIDTYRPEYEVRDVGTCLLYTSDAADE